MKHNSPCELENQDLLAGNQNERIQCEPCGQLSEQQAIDSKSQNWLQNRLQAQGNPPRSVVHNRQRCHPG
ncbi:MAG: hypothetical protein CBB71_04795 [Rhodopirellula sp. TMED11]|nr:MAG: hypothetical protein CBB71_04795 [Rhodopirellula sp. TMED11]